MKEEVQNKLFEAKKYTEYVVCKTLKLQKFEIETGDNEKLLWPIYLEIFGKSNFSRTRAYMAANQEFLAKIMKDESFVGMNDEAVMCLAAMPQTSSCILDVFNRGYTFALEYFTKINGFVDKAAATSFVEFIETSQDLLKSDELYEHVHEKLVNGVLKGKYTRARTKHGYAKPD